MVKVERIKSYIRVFSPPQLLVYASFIEYFDATRLVTQFYTKRDLYYRRKSRLQLHQIFDSFETIRVCGDQVFLFYKSGAYVELTKKLCITYI